MLRKEVKKREQVNIKIAAVTFLRLRGFKTRSHQVAPPKASSLIKVTGLCKSQMRGCEPEMEQLPTANSEMSANNMF